MYSNYIRKQIAILLVAVTNMRKTMQNMSGQLTLAQNFNQVGRHHKYMPDANRCWHPHLYCMKALTLHMT